MLSGGRSLLLIETVFAFSPVSLFSKCTKIIIVSQGDIIASMRVQDGETETYRDRAWGFRFYDMLDHLSLHLCLCVRVCIRSVSQYSLG